jgi:hypothetical protein
MTSDRPDITGRLEEYSRLGREPGRNELFLLEAAMFLEESFHIHLSDAEISPESIGTFALMERLVAEKLGGA